MHHFGLTCDVDVLIDDCAESARKRNIPLYAVGVSMGGNILLRWLAAHPTQRDVTAAVAISVPYDLAASAAYMSQGASRLYVRKFLTTLKPKALYMARSFPGLGIDVAATQRAQTFAAYDDAATARACGFGDAATYYAAASSLHCLDHVETPTLCINAADDPFLPRSSLDAAIDAMSPAVESVVTQAGGHVGFTYGLPWRSSYWAEEHALAWLNKRAHAET